jgi:hypothetical protein
MSAAVKPVTPALPKRTPLASLKAERVSSPHLILIHGLPGIGKTSLAAQFPDPIFLCAEAHGADEQPVARWPETVESWDDVRDVARRLTVEEHRFKTLVIDKIEDIEPLCWKETLKRDPKGRTLMVEAFDGYQKAFDVAIDDWRNLALDIERMQAARGINVVLLSHAMRRNFKDPTQENYDRWEPNVEKRAAAFLVGWVRTVLFLDQDVITAKLEKGDKAKAKVVETGARVIRTERNAAYDAKNRLALPSVLPMGSSGKDAYEAFMRWTDPLLLKLQISALLKDLDEETKAKVSAFVAEAGDFAPELARGLHRLTALIAERKKGS